MPKGSQLPWDRWFALPRFRLVRGVHFGNSPKTFAQTVRNAASRRGVGVSLLHSVQPAAGAGLPPVPCLVVTVVGRPDLSPPRPKGFASPKLKHPNRKGRRAAEAED